MLKAIIFGILFFVLSACKTASVAENTKPDMKEVVNNQDIVLVDVRIPEQYEQETAKNAVNIPLAELEKRSKELKDKKVVVFCNRGIQADEAVQILKKKGIEIYDGTSLLNIKAIQNLKN